MGFLFSKPSGDTYLSQAKNTSYSTVLTRPMKFTIYLHRGGSWGKFHDKIVVASEEQYGGVTLELSVNDKKQDKEIKPKCEDFIEDFRQLQRKKVVVCTFKELANDAMRILSKMQTKPYKVGDNDCQKFCNAFLKKLGAETYVTTSEQIDRLTGTRIRRAIISYWTKLTTSPSVAKLNA